jgi:hypothetical protein
MEEEGDIQ